MKIIDQLIKKASEDSAVSQKEAHEAIMFQFEYASKAVRGSDLTIEISGLGYLKFNKKKFLKEYNKMVLLLSNMKSKYERLESEGEKVLLKYKLDNLEEIIKDYDLKLAEIKKDLEKTKGNSTRNLEQDIS